MGPRTEASTGHWTGRRWWVRQLCHPTEEADPGAAGQLASAPVLSGEAPVQFSLSVSARAGSFPSRPMWQFWGPHTRCLCEREQTLTFGMHRWTEKAPWQLQCCCELKVLMFTQGHQARHKSAPHLARAEGDHETRLPFHTGFHPVSLLVTGGGEAAPAGEVESNEKASSLQ